MDKNEALKMAIEGLEQLLLFLYQEEETALYCNKFYEIQTAKKNIEECNKKINACKEALEQPAQEPTAYIKNIGNEGIISFAGIHDEGAYPVYTHPHQWQGLTDDEIARLVLINEVDKSGDTGFARLIGHALKEKNHG
jgi:hypothetical protein